MCIKFSLVTFKKNFEFENYVQPQNITTFLIAILQKKKKNEIVVGTCELHQESGCGGWISQNKPMKDKIGHPSSLYATLPFTDVKPDVQHFSVIPWQC